MNEPGGLLPSATENQRSIGRFELASNFFQSKQAGSIQRGHVAQAKNHNRGQCMDLLGYERELLRRAEQERSMDAEDGGVIGDVFVLQDVDASVLDVFVGDLRNRS